MSEYTPLSPKDISLFDEIQRRILRLQSGGTIDSLQNIGADVNNQIGASFVSLKQLASNYPSNETIASMLWATGKREQQIIACFLLPANINREKITQLSDTCMNHEIAGYFGSVYLAGHSILPEIAEEWIESQIPFRQIAILTAIARHLIIYKKNSKISKQMFSNLLEREYADPYVKLVAKRYRFNI